MTSKKLVTLIVLLSPTICFGGRISFGSDNSAINVGKSATFNISSGMTNRGGRIIQYETGGITGGNICFEKGFFEDGASEILLTGEMHPGDLGDSMNTYTVHMHGTDANPHRFNAAAGTAIETLEVSGGYNRLEGNPSFNNPLKLEDETTTLTVAIQSVLNQTIEMNGGTIVLDDDLRLADGITFNGTGTLKLNSRQLSFGGSDVDWTGTTYWNNAQDIAFRSNTNLTGMWVFEGDSFISGESTILDLTHGGTLWIKPNSSVYITQVKIRGIGNDPGNGTLIFEDNTSKLYMRRSALEFLTTYTFDRGQMITEVGSAKMILRDHVLWIASPGVLTVDGVNLFYNTRTFPNNNNIRSSDPGAIQLINNGRILHFRSFEDYTNNTSEGGILEKNKFLGDGGTSSTLTIIKDFPEFDGKGWYMHFSRTPLVGIGTLKMLSVQDDPSGVAAVLTHIVLKDFSSDYLSIPNSATLTFGDKTTIELAANEDLQMTWTFEGECVINGKGNTLSLENNGGLDIRDNVAKWGKHSSLLLKDMTIKGLSNFAIRCLDNTGTITFQNVTLLLSNNYTITTGHFEILDEVYVQKLTSTSNAQFVYNVDGQTSKILAGSKLHFDHNTTFRYDPLSPDNNLIEFENETSTLSINGATLFVTDVGLELTNGTLLIDHKCFIESQATVTNQAVSFGDGTNAENDLHIEVMPGGNIDVVTGILQYNNVGG